MSKIIETGSDSRTKLPPCCAITTLRPLGPRVVTTAFAS